MRSVCSEKNSASYLLAPDVMYSALHRTCHPGGQQMETVSRCNSVNELPS